ncbi:putative C1A cysteine protease [Operophtera brumata]|uniref:Putative C1A cysteine protease n=1 Tax=Operophtera brumata TaxID=104452 RepID=A0A0L7K356_OPEBR|nr:putative C1A cysteine protease [Operophtera brumata]
MTDRVCIYSRGKKQFHFSAEDLVSCCEDCGSCRGGDPEFAWKYWQEHGIVSGGNYNSSLGCRSYSTPPCVHHAPGQKINATRDRTPCFDLYVDTPKCSKICDDKFSVAYEKDKLYGQNVFSIVDGEDHIMAELFLNGPVEAIMLVYLDFFNYKSGVYVPVNKVDYIGAHAVKIIGWGVENDTKYWLVANSWNSGWGDNGFFKILRGENECLIELMIMAGEPLLINE